MNAVQVRAIMKPVNGDEELKPFWENPRAFNFDKHRVSLVTLVVVKDGEDYCWNVSVRIQNMIRKRLKLAALFTTYERLKVKRILENELSGVGVELGAKEFTTKVAMHLSKKLTPEESFIMLSPHLLGN